MKCENCGTENPEDATFCKNCGTNLKTNNDEQDENIKDNNTSIYISIFLISIICSFFLQSPLAFFIAMISIITGKIKYPDNKIIKILFYLMILFFIIWTIFIIILISICNGFGDFISSCPE